MSFAYALPLFSLHVMALGMTCTDKTTAADVLHGIDLSGQVYVITGGDSGIGYATALSLAANNATILLGVRDTTGKGRAAADNITRLTGNARVSVEHLDLASFDLVRQFADTVAHKVPKVHTLLCNAGIDHSPSSHPLTEDGFDMTFQVNFLGHFLLIDLLLPKLRESRGRIVHVSSGASFSACTWGDMPSTCTDADEILKDAKRAFHGNNSAGSLSSNYALSKWLQVFHAAELARTETNITAFSLHPGLVKSAMTDALPPSTIKNWCRGDFTNCPLTPAEGAATSAYLSTASIDDVSSSDGAYFDHCKSTTSVRSVMVLSHGEKAVIAYQEQIYAIAKEATKTNMTVLV